MRAAVKVYPVVAAEPWWLVPHPRGTSTRELASRDDEDRGRAAVDAIHIHKFYRHHLARHTLHHGVGDLHQSFNYHIRAVCIRNHLVRRQSIVVAKCLLAIHL